MLHGRLGHVVACSGRGEVGGGGGGRSAVHFNEEGGEGGGEMEGGRDSVNLREPAIANTWSASPAACSVCLLS